MATITTKDGSLEMRIFEFTRIKQAPGDRKEFLNGSLSVLSIVFYPQCFNEKAGP